MKEYIDSEVGTVRIFKHKKSKSIRVTMPAHNQVKVIMPSWLPYEAGLRFVNSKKEWIQNNSNKRHSFINNQKIGKTDMLKFINDPKSTKLSSKIVNNTVKIYVPQKCEITDGEVQQYAKRAVYSSLKKQSEVLLKNRIDELSAGYGYKFNILRLRPMRSRWGSCTSSKDITLNTLLLNLPWELIDHVIIHELVHTKVLRHGPDFWKEFEIAKPGAKTRQKKLKQYPPPY